jgi:hypothetical protein
MSVLHDAPRRSRLASGWGQLELPLTPRPVIRGSARGLAAPPKVLLSRPLRPAPSAPDRPPMAREDAGDGR